MGEANRLMRPPRVVRVMLAAEAGKKTPERRGLLGLLENNLGTILTFVGALATAGVAFFGGVFQKNEAPEARIALIVGTERVVFGPRAASDAALLVIPTGRPIRVSGSASSDPDDPIERLDFRWSVRPMFAHSDGSRPEIKMVPDQDAKAMQWIASEPGPYEISLDLTDDHRCNWLQKLIAEGGCRKSSTATGHVIAREPAPPTLFVTGKPTSGVLPFSTSFDASRSKSFDGSTSLHFLWFVNGSAVSDRESYVLKIGKADDEFSEPGSYAIKLIVEDRWGYRREREIQVAVTSPKDSATGSVGQGSSGPASSPSAETSNLADPMFLSGPEQIGKDGQALRLPRRIVTNGYPLTIRAGHLVASDTEILSFEQTAAARGRDGSRGEPGVSASGEGESGKPGGAGESGGPGVDGRSAQPITVLADTLEGRLLVRNNGQTGGPGGNGGDGGAGGAGARGAPSRSGFLNCNAGPGHGGNGGPGGRGGSAGSGGAGGSGGPVTVILRHVAPSASIEVEAVGAPGGEAGRPGTGAPGGPGGPEGSTGGFCSGAGRQGITGAAGAPGVPASPGRPGVPASIRVQVGEAVVEGQGRLAYPRSRQPSTTQAP